MRQGNEKSTELARFGKKSTGNRKKGKNKKGTLGESAFFATRIKAATLHHRDASLFTNNSRALIKASERGRSISTNEASQ